MPSHAERLRRVDDLLATAGLERRKGDALKRTGRAEEARDAWRSALTSLENARKLLEDPEWNRVETFAGESELPEDQHDIVQRLVETMGQAGGLHRRLEELGPAIDSYRRAGVWEARYHSASTYNRINEIKLSLLAGKQLSDLQPQIRRLATELLERLRTDSKLGDSGWAWADLGDLRVLLPDQLNAAETAYRSFIEKADRKAPETTLGLMREIAEKLTASHDPQAQMVAEGVERLEGLITAT